MKSGKHISSSQRIGIGYDIHRFTEDRPLVLGGVTIPFEKGLDGHSDADVLVHAIADALLGAAALGDIGKHFPNSDPQLKNISSLLLLEKVHSLLQASSFTIVNVDSMLILERPKIIPYVDAMRANIARAIRTDIEAVSVKATTNEGMGHLGRGEGVAAHAIACVQRRP